MKLSHIILSLALLTGGNIAFAQDDAKAPAEEAAPAPAAHKYKIDAGKTLIYAKTTKGGVLAAAAHDHVIQAKQIQGNITFSESDASKNLISVTIDVASMEVDGAKLRSIAGMDGGPSAEDAKAIKDNMLADDQLKVSKHKKMAFKSSAITPKGGDKYTIEGNLTIRGVTKKISFPATITADAGTFHGKGKVTIKHTDFGFEPYSAAFGAITNTDPILLSIDLYGKAQ